jgi:hypothetical protein
MSKDLKRRLEEMQEIYSKLDALGCSNDFEAIREWKKLAQNYLKTGENSSGKILFPEAGRVLIYQFSNRLGCDTILEIKRHG